MTKQTYHNNQATFSAPIEEVTRQSVEITHLKQQMQLLYQRVEAADLSEGIAPFDPSTNIPPHY